MVFREIPVAPGARRVRLELPGHEIAALAALGLKAGGLSVAAVCRIVMGLVARGETVTERAVVAEAARVVAAVRAARGPAQAEGRRPRGRPRKDGRKP